LKHCGYLLVKCEIRTQYSNGIYQRKRGIFIKKFQAQTLEQNKQTRARSPKCFIYTGRCTKFRKYKVCVCLVDTQEPAAVDVMALKLDVVYIKSIQKLNMP
jgi:hypothetical protein